VTHDGERHVVHGDGPEKKFEDCLIPWRRHLVAEFLLLAEIGAYG
jgi:hypothetical protein